MKHLKGRIATSHIDSQNERMTFAALGSMVEQINTQRIPMGIEHDPCISPQGRAVSAQLEELEDGEFAVVAISEVFEEGDEIEFRDNGREMPLREFGDGRLYIIYDNSYRDQSDQELLDGQSATIATTIYQPARRTLRFCHGYPCQSPYQTITFDNSQGFSSSVAYHEEQLRSSELCMKPSR